MRRPRRPLVRPTDVAKTPSVYRTVQYLHVHLPAQVTRELQLVKTQTAIPCVTDFVREREERSAASLLLLPIPGAPSAEVARRNCLCRVHPSLWASWASPLPRLMASLPPLSRSACPCQTDPHPHRLFGQSPRCCARSWACKVPSQRWLALRAPNLGLSSQVAATED